jgi:hypothetical protein
MVRRVLAGYVPLGVALVRARRWCTGVWQLVPFALAAGCNNTSMTNLQAPSDVPAFTIDVDASDVKVLGSTDADNVRTLGAAALTSMATMRNGGELRPARFTAVVHASEGSNGGAVVYCVLPLLPLIVFGIPLMACPLSAYDATVDLRLETAKGVFVGRGESSHRLTHHGDPAVWHAAVHDAFQDALQNAQRSREGNEADGSTLAGAP